MTRGFPTGESVTLELPFRMLQHALLAMALITGLVRTFTLNRTPSMSQAWFTLNVLLVLSVLSITTLTPLGSQLGAAVISAVNIAQVALLWVLSYEVARHTRFSALAVLGGFWLCHLLFREAGRLLSLVAGPSLTNEQTFAMAGIMILMTTSMILLLTDRIPVVRPFFADFWNAPLPVPAAADAGRVSRIAASARDAGNAGGMEEPGGTDGIDGTTDARAGGSTAHDMSGMVGATPDTSDARSAAHRTGNANGDVSRAAGDVSAHGAGGVGNVGKKSGSGAESSMRSEVNAGSANSRVSAGNERNGADAGTASTTDAGAERSDDGAAPAEKTTRRTAASAAPQQPSPPRQPSPPSLPWDDPSYGLTAREREVAALLHQGRTARKIADALFLSNETVRSYTKSIYAKLGIHSKQELIDLASPESPSRDA
ncbi:hypothetical protein HLV35_05600 [Eggerthellaceae bacterium zg-997]|nr:hypothetical protein [Eggerthellaceae bacterium zg-997]